MPSVFTERVKNFFQPNVVNYIQYHNEKEVTENGEVHVINEHAAQIRKQFPRSEPKDWGKWEFLKVFDWYPSHYSKEEKWLLFKIDLVVLGYGFINFYNKYLDQSNITNAYVSGMEEDLKMNANQYNNMISMYDIGYCIGEIPALIFMTRKNSWYLLPAAELLWGIATICSSKVTSYNQLYAIRFLVGIFESPTFPGIHYTLGSWYQSSELHKRAGVFFVSSAVGSMSAGYLQAAAYDNLSGVNGISGWRWMFIIDALLTIPTAFYGFAFFPGIPKFKRPKSVFTQDEFELARSRMAESGVEDPKPLDWSIFRRVLGKWQIWIFTLLWCFANSASYTQSFNLWLKAEGSYSVYEINVYPTIGQAYSCVIAILFAAAVDIYPRQKVVPPLYILLLFSYIVLLIWNVPTGLKFAAYILMYSSAGCSPIYLSWVTDTMKDDSEGRAITLAFINSVSFAFAAFIPNLAYNAEYSPKFTRGFGASVGMYAFTFSMFWVVSYILWREKKILKRLQFGVSSDDSEAASVVEVQEVSHADKNSATRFNSSE